MEYNEYGIQYTWERSSSGLDPAATMARRHVLFDLDNTLYPPGAGLMAELDRRITHYFVRRLHLHVPEAERLQAEYCWQYGSCTNGILTHARLDLDRFLREVHEIDVRRHLSADPSLAKVLTQLPLEKWVFTNAPLEHARRVLDALGITGHFRGVFDIRFLDFVGKPDPEAYHRVLAALRARGDQCAMVEDSLHNLLPAKALGMATVLISWHGPLPAARVDAVLPDLEGLPAALAGLRGNDAVRRRREFHRQRNEQRRRA